MATIRVTREAGRSVDRRRAYSVVVDDTEVGQLKRGEMKDFPLRPGSHVVRVSIDAHTSRAWETSLGEDDVVSFVCRSRRKSDNHVDLFLADAGDQRTRHRPLDDHGERDVGTKQRVLTRDGQVLYVWAHRSGYLRSLDPGSGSSDTTTFFVELAIYVLVLPVLAVLRWVRHRLLFKRGWSVGVVRERRFLWPKKVRLERLRTEAEARARAAEVIAELEGSPTSC